MFFFVSIACLPCITFGRQLCLFLEQVDREFAEQLFAQGRAHMSETLQVHGCKLLVATVVVLPPGTEASIVFATFAKYIAFLTSERVGGACFFFLISVTLLVFFFLTCTLPNFCPQQQKLLTHLYM